MRVVGIDRLHVDDHDAAIIFLGRHPRRAAVMILRGLQGEFNPIRLAIASALFLAASNLFDDPGIQHRVTSHLVRNTSLRPWSRESKVTGPAEIPEHEPLGPAVNYASFAPPGFPNSLFRYNAQR